MNRSFDTLHFSYHRELLGASGDSVEVRTATQSYGELEVDGTVMKHSGVSVDLMRNAAAMLAVLLENCNQKKLLLEEKFRPAEHISLRTAQLQQSNAALTEAQRIAKVGSWSIDLQTRNLSWSEEMFRLYDLPLSETTPPLEEIWGRFIPRTASLRGRRSMMRWPPHLAPTASTSVSFPVKGRFGIFTGAGMRSLMPLGFRDPLLASFRM